MEGKAAFGTLCFYCSFLRGGYSLLASPYAYADEMTVDTGAPSPGLYGTDRYYGATSLSGASSRNKLIVKGSTMATGWFMGGWAQGTSGDATNNMVEMTETAKVYSTGAGVFGVTGVYGGWSRGGNATNNTIVLSGEMSGYGDTILFGGHSETTGTDVTTGNMLWVKKRGNSAYSIFRFQKIKFSLDSASPNDVMLKVNTNYGVTQGFKWSDIEVENPSAWQNGAVGSKRVTLYQGPMIQLTNYNAASPVNGTSGDYEYGVTTNTTAAPGTSTVGATEIYFDRNKFKNSHVTYNNETAQADDEKKGIYHTLPSATGIYSGAIYAGTSTLGNTTTKNVLTVDGMNIGYRTLYGGYTQSVTGDSTGNEVVLKNMPAISNTTNIYAGWSKNGKATGNTITLGGALGNSGGSMYTNANLYGGYSGKTGATAADHTAGNTLQVTAKNSAAYTINNFEKMKFVLGDSIGSGDTMLYVNTENARQTFDWSKITVTGLSDWVAALNATGTNDPKLTLYTGAALTLNNYAPRLIENAGDYEFGTFANGTLASETMTGATQIKLAGNKFQNVTLPVVNTATSSVHGGYSSYGNTTNTNVITVNSGVYTNVRAGYTDAVKGGSDKNALTFTGTASATNLYGGYTTGTSASAVDLKADAAAKADAKGNTVNISGGTISANGKIAGGYIAKNTTLATPVASAGDAKGNKVNIESGTIGNNTFIYGGYTEGAGGATGNIVTISGGTFSGTSSIYGGYTEGTGKATGNTVNLGKADGTLSATGLTNVTLYGGGGTAASDSVKDNVLNVNAKATAKNIQNFGKVMFNFNSTIHTGDTMLTLSDTAGTSLDWKKFDISGDTPPDGETTLMHNASGIALTSYDHSRAVSSTGTKEFVIYTDTGTDTGVKKILYGGYTFKGKTSASTNADGDIWAGRSVIGNTTSGNTLTVNNNTATYRDAYGGWTAGTGTDATGDAANSSTGNTVNLTSGTVRNIYGGFTSSDGGSATGNKVNISGGTVGTGGTVYGGYIPSATSTGSATGNSVTITGGSMGDVYGGFTAGTGKATGNTVNLGDGEHSLAATINGTIYGGFTAGTDTTGNTLNVKTNAAAANIKNFENLAFYVNSSALNATSPMLTLSSGATNNLDWRNLTVDASKFSGTISTFEPYNLVLMQNAAGISFMKGADDTYTLGGGVKSTTSGDFEFTIDTLSHAASTTQVTAAGYKFKNHTASYSEATPHTEAWAGRTAAGNKVEKNKLTVTTGNITAAAYGGLVINNKPNATTGDAENNMITVSGGNVQAAYGAKLLTKGGSATTNTAVITGGTVHDVYGASLAAVGATGTVTKGIVNLSNAANVTGNVYGGHIADSAATGTVTGSEVSLAGGNIGGTVYGGHNGGSGDAKGGKILLTGGSVTGNVYGGYAVGNGKTTGNVVTIGDGTNDATTVVTGTIAGGNKADATGNILAVQSKGAQAGTLSGFETIRFHLGPSVADGDNVLTLNQTTTLTYSTIEAPTGSTVSTWLGNVMEKNVHLLRMGAGKTLTLTGYHPATGSERSDDVEYSLVTDNNLGTTTAGGSLDLSAYKWRHADVKINSNAHANVFGGKTVYKTNGETKENKLTLQAGAAVTNAVAGDTQTASGTAEENMLTIEAGTATNAIGAKTKAGRAYKNKAILLGGSVTNLVGAESANGAAEENTAAVTGGTVTTAMGAHTLAGDATENHAVISGGTVTGSLKGAQSAGKAAKNTVEVKGGNLTGASVMGAEAAGDAEKNSVTITVTPTSNAATVITGAHSTAGSAVNNTVDVNAAVTGKIIGGSTDSAGLDAIDNIVNVKADVTGDVYGGHAARASLRNIVNIADGVTVTGNVYGGSCITAEGNIVNVGRGATVTGNVVAGNATGRNDNNIINLTGANVGGNVIGGVGGANDHDNTLAVCYETAHPTSHVSDFSGIKNLHFYLGEDIQNENPTLLKLGVTSKDIRGIDVGVGVKGRMARNLKVNDVISLMKVAGNGTLTTDADSVSPQVLVNHAEAMQGVSLLYGFDIMKRGTDELIATVTKAAISDQTKSFAETRAAATDFINRGANLLAGPGIASAKKAAGTEDKDARGYHLWAAMEHSDIETETGSFADTKGYHLSLGWARELKKKHATLTFTPFVEYGKGKYDSFLDDGTHGSGHVSYLGAGIMGRLEKTNGVWAEAALHGGKARSDYSGSIYSGTNSHYDSANAYYAAHLGIGKEFRVNAKDRLDTYLRYFWSRQSGMQADIATSGRGAGVDTYDFGVVNSNRVRMGFRYTHKDSEKSEILAGLAWEYELSGKAGVSFQGYDAPSPSLRGGSLMLELAYRFAPKNSRFSYNVHMTGWQGTHRGVTGGAQVNWAF